MRYADVKNLAEYFRSHAGTESEVDGEGQAEPDGMQAVVDAVKVDRSLSGTLRPELFLRIVVWAEEGVQLELAGVSLLSHPVFLGRERSKVAIVERAGVVLAFEGGAQAVLLPLEERTAAMWAPVLCFAFPPRLVGRRGFSAELAKYL